jgi:hypothetical protein
LVLERLVRIQWRFDQGINSIKYVKNDPKQGVVITIENFEKCQCQWFRYKIKKVVV